MAEPRRRSELKSVPYELFIAALSILSIVNFVLVWLLRADEDLQDVLRVMNVLLSSILLGDFFYRFATAPSRTQYFVRGFGWADLLASLPTNRVNFLRIFRLVRVARLMRAQGGRAVARNLGRELPGSTLLSLLLMGILVLEFGSLQMLAIEKSAPGANITTAYDAIWYTLVTIATVGYGDRFPVTDAGRFVGSGIIVVGVGIFGTFTGYLTNAFLSRRRHGEGATADDGAPLPDARPAASGVTAEAAPPEEGVWSAESGWSAEGGWSAESGPPTGGGAAAESTTTAGEAGGTAHDAATLHALRALLAHPGASLADVLGLLGAGDHPAVGGPLAGTAERT